MPRAWAAPSPAADLLRVREGLARPDGAVVQLLPQRGAVEQLHDGEGDVVLDPDIEDAEDVGMRERGDRLRLALEARARGRIGGQRGRQNLEGDVAIEFGVPRPIDLAHPARADGGEDLVRTEARARGEGQNVRSV